MFLFENVIEIHNRIYFQITNWHEQHFRMVTKKLMTLTFGVSLLLLASRGSGSECNPHKLHWYCSTMEVARCLHSVCMDLTITHGDMMNLVHDKDFKEYIKNSCCKSPCKLKHVLGVFC